MFVPSKLLKKITNSLKNDSGGNIPAAEIIINDNNSNNLLKLNIDGYDINHLVKLLELCSLDLEIFENNVKKLKGEL